LVFNSEGRTYIPTKAGSMSLFLSPVAIFIYMRCPARRHSPFKTTFLKVYVQQAHICAMFGCLQIIWRMLNIFFLCVTWNNI